MCGIMRAKHPRSSPSPLRGSWRFGEPMCFGIQLLSACRDDNTTLQSP
ncbi:MAG: hypothetical protein LBQ66_06880 [Planctomycetaceae bacterium]|nr:hypothetical protein [Planctomycetaceae bacterium]